MRHGTAEAAGAAPAAHRPGRGDLVPGLQRAQRRLRPRLARPRPGDGDGWRVSGQKIWTSYATMAQWCFLLARTSRGERKQQGLTIFLVPMDAPARGAAHRHAQGPHHLNEVFLDEVWVEGGRARTSTRAGRSCRRCSPPSSGSASPATPVRAAPPVGAGRARRHLGAPAELRGAGRMLVHCRRARLLAYRVIDLQATGRVTPGDTAAYRIAVTRLDQESAEVLREIAALGPGSDGSDGSMVVPPAASNGRSRTTGATPRRPPCPPAASRCSASRWPAPPADDPHAARFSRTRRNSSRLRGLLRRGLSRGSDRSRPQEQG